MLETIYNVYRALEKQMPVTDKYVSVVAEVSRPVTVRVPIGCTLDEVVEQAGEITTKRRRIFCRRTYDGADRQRFRPGNKRQRMRFWSFRRII